MHKLTGLQDLAGCLKIYTHVHFYLSFCTRELSILFVNSIIIIDLELLSPYLVPT